MRCGYASAILLSEGRLRSLTIDMSEQPNNSQRDMSFDNNRVMKAMSGRRGTGKVEIKAVRKLTKGCHYQVQKEDYAAKRRCWLGSSKSASQQQSGRKPWMKYLADPNNHQLHSIVV